MADVAATDLVAAAEFLSARGLYGVVWADRNFIAQQRHGALVGAIPLGKAITESLLALIGFDDQIEALQRRPTGNVTIPNVQLDSSNRNTTRVNIIIYWISEEHRYILLLTKATPTDDLEVALTAQVRARAMAEADATAKSRLLARVNDELSRANQDLQAFASIISHDLRSPLRRMRAFATNAVSALDADKIETATNNILQLQTQAKRMGTMLTGLLEYSRISHKSTASEIVDTGALSNEIAGSVNKPDGFEIIFEGEWPSFWTLAQPLDIVMRNLIENAVKHHDRQVGTIIVHGEDTPEAWILSVVDDGPGISPPWHHAIFEPFRRIADADEGPEGSGIGLALVKRTIETYGGRIELLSDPSLRRGTTFRVHWPKMPPHVPSH